VKPAFFLDRDGTINIDRVYINDPRLIELIPGAAAAVKRAQAAGFLIVVVTNQSGIARGIIDPGALPKIHARLDELLASEAGASVDRYEICVHRPEEGCECRKPKPRMVREAAKALGIDLSRSVFVGDRLSDVATGIASGCRYSILLRTGMGEKAEKLLDLRAKPEETPDYVAHDLGEAVDWALERIEV
jgi:histidinol-phosphate phosphatase family protein